MTNRKDYLTCMERQTDTRERLLTRRKDYVRILIIKISKLEFYN